MIIYKLLMFNNFINYHIFVNLNLYKFKSVNI